MAHREIRDSSGRMWDVWSVIPERAERRHASAAVPPEADRRSRRNTGEFRVPLGQQWIHGWLAFETKGEKRRLAPIPDGWENATDDELREMCEQAAAISRPPRRLAE